MPHVTTDLPGKGTKLQIKISGTFTDVPETYQIEWGDFTLGIRKPTTLAAESEKKRPTIANLGKVTFSIYHDPNDSVHQALQGKILAPPAAPDDFQLVFNDGSATTPAQIAFQGYLVEYPLSGFEVEGTVESKAAIEVTDLFTPTAGT